MITDGGPTDEWASAAQAVREGEASKQFAFFAIGVKGANLQILSQISSARQPLSLEGLKFRELFSWLSSSLRSVSRSTPGTEVALESPKGWASVLAGVSLPHRQLELRMQSAGLLARIAVGLRWTGLPTANLYCQCLLVMVPAVH